MHHKEARCVRLPFLAQLLTNPPPPWRPPLSPGVGGPSAAASALPLAEGGAEGSVSLETAGLSDDGAASARGVGLVEAAGPFRGGQEVTGARGKGELTGAGHTGVISRGKGTARPPGP